MKKHVENFFLRTNNKQQWQQNIQRKNEPESRQITSQWAQEIELKKIVEETTNR